jgi:hypothetical protein
LFSKQNKDQCKVILSNIDNWLCSKFIDANNNLSFRQSPEVRVFTSTIEQRKTQNQVKFNAYASWIAKRCCTENPNEATESFDTAPDSMPKCRIILTYAAAVTTAIPCPAQQPTQSHAASDYISTTSKQDSTATTSGDNIRLAELKFSLRSIQSEFISMQLYHQIMRDDFQKVMSGFLKHSKEIQAKQSDVGILSAMILEIRNSVLPNSPPHPA